MSDIKIEQVEEAKLEPNESRPQTDQAENAKITDQSSSTLNQLLNSFSPPSTSTKLSNKITIIPINNSTSPATTPVKMTTDLAGQTPKIVSSPKMLVQINNGNTANSALSTSPIANRTLLSDKLQANTTTNKIFTISTANNGASGVGANNGNNKIQFVKIVNTANLNSSNGNTSAASSSSSSSSSNSAAPFKITTISANSGNSNQVRFSMFKFRSFKKLIALYDRRFSGKLFFPKN